MEDELKIAENNPAALQINKQCAFYHGTGFCLTTDFNQAQKYAKDRVRETCF